MSARTTAQWRTEVPAYDTAVRAVEAVRASGLPALVVAHLHPDTRNVSIILHGGQERAQAADRVLTGFGVPAGGWVLEVGHDHEIYRKQVAR